jgi:GT2 family glycosyltransferase
MAQMKYSVIIPNYNGYSLLKENLPKIVEIMQEKDSVVEVIVVDDGSEDQSVEYISTNFPQVEVLQNNKNQGFGYACNQGVEKAAGEIILLLNTDVIPESKDFINKVEPYFKQDDTFAVGFLDLVKENGEVEKHGRGVGYFKKGWFFHKKAALKKGNSLWASGGSAAFSKTKWNELGGFDTVYAPFYWEDVDLGLRAWLNGYQIYFDPEIRMEHNHQQGSIKANYKRNKIKAIAYRNQLLFNWKFFSWGKYLPGQVSGLIYFSLTSLFAGEWAFFKGFFTSLPRISRLDKKKADVKILANKDIFKP